MRLSPNGVGSGDGEIAARLMKQAPMSVKRVFGGVACDGQSFCRAVEKHGAEIVVPPPRDAIVHVDATER